MCRRLLLLAGLILMTMPSHVAAQPSDASAVAPVRYTLRFPEPHTHYIDVEARIPTGGRPAVELFMPVWTPGSYLVREYSRHVDDLRAEAGGGPLKAEKVAKNRWRVETSGADEIVLRYRVYAREMSVRTNYVDAEFALINGAATFITLAGDGKRPHFVSLELPSSWRITMSGLEGSGKGHEYRAEDYDTLVDSPIVAGTPTVHEFAVRGVPHFLVNVGGDELWDGARAAADVQKIVEAQAAFWGGLPYKKYVILNVISEASGGLEHRNSTVLMTSRWKMRTRRAYVDWLNLVSHELFHVWNVKRLHPVELGPFDYEAENYTRLLWVVEGITSYYDSLLAMRAGVITRDEYLAELGGQIRELQSTPGRFAQSLRDASFDAWIRYYRQDENTPNTTVSYYTKGAVVAFLLDLEVRRATSGARSLDDVMRAAYREYSGASGFSSEQFRDLASRIAGRDLGSFFARAVDSTEELDYSTIEWLGLRLRPEPETRAAWLGLTLGPGRSTLKDDGGRLVVTQVRRGTPAFDAGVNVDDEILAIGGYRVRPSQWASRLELFSPGERTTLLLARRDRLLTVEVEFGSERAGPGRLEIDPHAPPDAQQRLASWLKS